MTRMFLPQVVWAEEEVEVVSQYCLQVLSYLFNVAMQNSEDCAGHAIARNCEECKPQ